MNNEIKRNMVAAQIERLEKALRYTEKVVESAPDGRVVIRNKNGHPYLTSIIENNNGLRKEKCVKPDSEYAKAAINALYCKKLQSVLRKELSCLQRFDSQYNPEEKYQIYYNFPPELQKLIRPIFKDKAMLRAEWQGASFESNSYPIDQSHTLLTNRGESVRSKSEVIIANVLDQMGLAYKYECMYQFGSWQTAPDFTVFNERDGLLYYIEYFGMMDDAEYQRDALKKISRYQQTPDANRFIYIFESKDAPMNMKAIENLLRVYF